MQLAIVGNVSLTWLIVLNRSHYVHEAQTHISNRNYYKDISISITQTRNPKRMFSLECFMEKIIMVITQCFSSRAFWVRIVPPT